MSTGSRETRDWGWGDREIEVEETEEIERLRRSVRLSEEIEEMECWETEEIEVEETEEPEVEETEEIEVDDPDGLK
jgi:hypothetical protein